MSKLPDDEKKPLDDVEKSRRSFLDDDDKNILNELQKDCRINLVDLAKKLDIPKSTIHYRIKRLEEENIIEGYHAKVDLFKMGDDFQGAVLIRAKYGPDFTQKVGEMLSTIPGVWAVYNILGEIDFIVLMRAENREEFVKRLEIIESSNVVERTNTLVIANIVKEDEKYIDENPT